MNPDGLNLLRYAIVKQAAMDYLDSLRIMSRNKPESSAYGKAAYMAASAETFLRKYSGQFVDIDGAKLMETIREESCDPTFRIGEEKICTY